jgi:hypothetical protein
LAEIRLKWSNSTDCGRKFSKLSEFRPKFRTKTPTMGQISANLENIRPKSVAEIKLRAFDRFGTNFGQKILCME